MNIKDKRVDKVLKVRNFNNPEIYYSPIVSWFIFFFLLFSANFSIFIFFAFTLYYPLWILYFVVGYFISSYLNNSFALTENELHIINPNFPFRKFKSYALRNIKLITIEKTKQKWHYVFGIIGGNYIVVQTMDKKEQYFCVGLEIDAYDENWTEKTIDDFYNNLRNKSIRVIFNLD